jgi:hypothetical protein
VLLKGTQDVVRQRHTSPATCVLDAAVLLELPAVPEGDDHPACLEESDVVGLVVDTSVQVPPERFVERLRT